MYVITNRLDLAKKYYSQASIISPRFDESILNLTVLGGYYICFNISFSIDAIGINTLYFSIDGTNEKKRIDVNITNNTYTIDIFQFINVTVNPTPINLYVLTTSAMNINIINFSINIIKNY